MALFSFYSGGLVCYVSDTQPTSTGYLKEQLASILKLPENQIDGWEQALYFVKEQKWKQYFQVETD